MSFGFPLYINLSGNNCVILGGGRFAASRTVALLKFEAKVTVISPTLCKELQELDKSGAIRYIPRRYCRGDCTSAYLCVAATDTESVNIAISDECKAKGIPVNLSKPAAFGTFTFPSIILSDTVSISLSGNENPDVISSLCKQIEQELPTMLEKATKPTSHEESALLNHN